MKPLVSVIMPAYNVERYIGESILSVQKQTFSDWELLIVNDGSTDGTEQVVNQFLTDARIKLLNQPNRGVSAARNNGLSCSSGTFIAFLDGDDLWHPQFLEKLISLQRDSNADFLFSGFNSLYESGNYKHYRYNYIDGNILLPYIEKKIRIHIGSCLISKRLLDTYHIQFTEGCAYSEDAEFIIKILVFAETKAVQEELMTCKIRMGSAIRSPWNYKQRISDVLVYERLAIFIDKHYQNTNKNLIKKVLEENLRYDKYRFLWKMIIARHLKEAKELLYDRAWNKDLEMLTPSVSLPHKLRIKIILSGNTALWRLATFNRKLKVKMHNS